VLADATSYSREPTSFLQGASASGAAWQQALAGVRAAVAAMPALKGLPPHKASEVTAFLESGHRATGGAGYAPQSATVQGILKDMYDTFASDLETMTQAEADQNQEYEAVMAVKQQEAIDMTATEGKKEEEKADAEVRLADTQQAYDDTKTEMEANIKFFDETKGACDAKLSEWNVRKGEREMELKGIAEAIKILTDDEARELFARSIKPGIDTNSFLQVGSDNSAALPTMKAFRALKFQATKAHSLRLASLASMVRTAKVGHFDKVIAAIDDMIQTLKDEDAADIAKRDQCKDEYTKIESAVKDLEWKIEKNVAKIDKLEELIKQREDEKVTTVEDIAQVKKEIEDMEIQRADENQAFLQEKKDDEDAIALLEKAKAALSRFYDTNKIELGPIQGSVKGVLLLQEKRQQEAQEPVFEVAASETPETPSVPEFEISEDQAPDATFSHRGHRKNESKGIISIIQMIIEDLGGEIKTGIQEEAAAQAEFEKQLAAAQKLQAELEEKLINLDEMIANRKGELEREHSIMKDNKADLKEQLDYKKAITPDCDWILNAFEERSDKRKAEMNGLVTAKEYLAGAAPPEAETAMLQEKKVPIFDDAAFASISFRRLSS